ncbi:MAG: tetratricopeptide repeat protein [Muribaculaceae bacterium]|nr:tetratricopeptide repeat protein [Muribaculaceae bacterium]
MNETFLKSIDALVASGDFQGAINQLSDAISATPDNDRLYLIRGKLFWRIGERYKATSDYSTAVHLNPESPARHLLEMAHNVADFFNPDLLNP